MTRELQRALEEIFDDHEAQLKAKDDEIRRLNNLYADTIKDLGDALIEIERLKADKECAKDVINWHEKECKQYIKLHHTKARSIVAMLFWEWRKHKRMYELTKFGSYLAITHLNNATLSKLIFQQAYKILKEQQ